MLGIMCINLDSFEILNLVLGNQSSLPDGNHQNGSVSFHIQDSIIKNICVRLSEFYSKGDIYTGDLVIDGEIILVNTQFQPETIRHKFLMQTEHWDDGVEVNYQFQVANVNIEFSWHWLADNLVPNYIDIEID
jgi:hypothetical protein